MEPSSSNATDSLKRKLPPDSIENVFQNKEEKFRPPSTVSFSASASDVPSDANSDSTTAPPPSAAVAAFTKDVIIQTKICQMIEILWQCNGPLVDAMHKLLLQIKAEMEKTDVDQQVAEPDAEEEEQEGEEHDGAGPYAPPKPCKCSCHPKPTRKSPRQAAAAATAPPEDPALAHLPDKDKRIAEQFMDNFAIQHIIRELEPQKVANSEVIKRNFDVAWRPSELTWRQFTVLMKLYWWNREFVERNWKRTADGLFVVHWLDTREVEGVVPEDVIAKFDDQNNIENIEE